MAAVKSAKTVVDKLIAAQQRENGGRYPETIAVVLWGTDNIKTYGESLARPPPPAPFCLQGPHSGYDPWATVSNLG